MTVSGEPAPRDGAGVRIPPPLYFVVPLLAGYLLQRQWPIALVPPAAARAASIVGAALVVAWIALMLSAFALFIRAKTSIIPVRPTTTIVVTGPYRFTRNPMYLGFALGYAGASLLWNACWPVILFPVALIAVRRLAIDREERYLERKFGGEYLAYRARVRRWL